MVELEIPGVPLVWKAPFVGSRGAWSVRTPILGQLRNHLRETYEGPILDEALAIDFIFVLPIPKSASKKMRHLMRTREVHPTIRKDRSNMLKFAEDVLKGVVIRDDCLIVDGRTMKIYGEEPMTIVRIYSMKEYEIMGG